MEADATVLEGWVGRSESTRDRIGQERCRAMQAALDRMDPPLGDGDPLPPLWHWLFFWTIAPGSELGHDGHPALGGFLPPVGAARRMWAGSRVSFPGTLTIGEAAERRSTITAVTPKAGRSGRLVFVTVRHEIGGAAGPTIVDEHDIVYREDHGAAAAAASGEAAPGDAELHEDFTADPTLLFRYSALTFNGHRIHYDRDYASRVEGYPGLVVHGPLLATLLVDLAARARPDRRIARFEFRALRPVFDSQPFDLNGRWQDDAAMELWVADRSGQLALQAQAEFDGAR